MALTFRAPMGRPPLRVEQKPVIALGPEMPGWGSWDWVGRDLARELDQTFRTTTFRGIDVPDCDVLVIVKHPLPLAEVERAAGRSMIIYLPVDGYGSAAEIDADGALLRRCGRVVVHCERLRRYFEPYAPVEYLDHHVKFVTDQAAPFREDGPVLWVGARSNLPPLVAWVNTHTLPAELLVLTNPENPGKVPTPAEFGFWADVAVRIEEWTPERHKAALSEYRAAIDIKGDDFRARHKPPAKAIDFLASGVPLAMNPDSSPVEHLARLGFDLASPLDVDRWLSREYWEETRRFGTAMRELFSRERVGRRFRRMIDEVLAER
jgi:hypothetical protein